MTSVCVYTYIHSVTYVSDNILKSIKDILRLSGLDPAKLTDDWDTYMHGVSTWLESQHLEKVKLEIYDPRTNDLVVMWELDVVYAWAASSDGVFWTDTEQLRYHILKKGLWPNQVDYRLLLQNKDGAPHVAGWGSATGRSTAGMVKQSLGSTIHHKGLGANAGYWRHP